MGAPFLLSAREVYVSLFGPRPPLVLDVSRPSVIEAAGWLMPSARVCTFEEAAGALRRAEDGPTGDRPIVVTCAHGHNRSQRVVAELRAAGASASMVEGGRDGWLAAGLPRVSRAARGVALGAAPTDWVTRRRPKIDRVACPWLVARFLDPAARFLFVEPDQVVAVAADLGGVAYDLPGGVFEHEGELCSFDVMLREFGLADDPLLAELALILRGADTDRLDLSPQCAGLLALSLGLSARHGDDDHAMLADGMMLYDALFSWLLQVRSERHSWVARAA